MKKQKVRSRSYAQKTHSSICCDTISYFFSSKAKYAKKEYVFLSKNKNTYFASDDSIQLCRIFIIPPEAFFVNIFDKKENEAFSLRFLGFTLYSSVFSPESLFFTSSTLSPSLANIFSMHLSDTLLKPSTTPVSIFL